MYCACSYAYTFYAASFMTGSGVEKIHSLIEEAAAQADEVDETYLQVLSVCLFVSRFCASASSACGLRHCVFGLFVSPSVCPKCC